MIDTQRLTNLRYLGGKLRLIFVLFYACAFLVEPVIFPKHTFATPSQAVLGMPFSGKWAYNTLVNPPYTDSNSSHPRTHNKPGAGDWATDIYADEGTNVKLDVTYGSGNVTYGWKTTSTTCGQSTGINILVDGNTIGWLYFAHLNNAVTSGTITNGMTLGTAHDWVVNGVHCNPGVHVHAEFKNSTNYSCYAENGHPGVSLDYGYDFAVLGSTNTAEREACSSIPPDAPEHSIALLGDVDGDSSDKKDAVLINPTSGRVYAALSGGSSFASPGMWSANAGIAGATKYFLADVNNDQRDDVVAFYAASGSWYAELSSGSGFWPPSQWSYNQGDNSSNQFVTDVTGDGKADVVLFWNQVSGQPNGMWAIDASSGSGFYGPPNQWITGAGVGSNSQVMGDFNYDGRIDAGMYYSSSGVWNVSLSTGSAFGYPGTWSSGHGTTSNKQFAGDVSGDGKSDTVYFWNAGANCGLWEAGASSGSGFYTPTYWATGQNCPSDAQFIGDVTGDGKADQVTYWRAVSGQPAGMWTVDSSSGSGFYGPPNQWRTGFGDNYN